MYLTSCPPFQIHSHLRSRLWNPPLGCRETRGFKCPLRLELRCPNPFWPQSFTTLFPILSFLFWVHGLPSNLCLHWMTYLRLIFSMKKISLENCPSCVLADLSGVRPRYEPSDQKEAMEEQSPLGSHLGTATTQSPRHSLGGFLKIFSSNFV